MERVAFYKGLRSSSPELSIKGTPTPITWFVQEEGRSHMTPVVSKISDFSQSDFLDQVVCSHSLEILCN